MHAAMDREGRPVRVSNRLGDVLEQLDLAQSRLSRLTGLACPVIRRVVKPDSNPRLDAVLRIIEALGVSIQEVFWLEQDLDASAKDHRACTRRRTTADDGHRRVRVA